MEHLEPKIRYNRHGGRKVRGKFRYEDRTNRKRQKWIAPKSSRFVSKFRGFIEEESVFNDKPMYEDGARMENSEDYESDYHSEPDYHSESDMDCACFFCDFPSSTCYCCDKYFF